MATRHVGLVRALATGACIACIASAEPARAEEMVGPRARVFAPVPAPTAAAPPLGPRTQAVPEPPRAWKWSGVLDVTGGTSFLLFTAGALSGLTLHELGHTFTNLALGNVPKLRGIIYGKFIPWFVIDPNMHKINGVYYKADGSVFKAGAAGFFAISTAGFHMQNIGSEVILSTTPGLISERAPFLKGMLWMNILLSIGYSTASFIGTEGANGDIRGAAACGPYPHQLLAGTIFANGAFDLLRYFFPENEVFRWFGRTSKATMLGWNFGFN